MQNNNVIKITANLSYAINKLNLTYLSNRQFVESLINNIKNLQSVIDMCDTWSRCKQLLDYNLQNVSVSLRISDEPYKVLKKICQLNGNLTYNAIISCLLVDYEKSLR